MKRRGERECNCIDCYKTCQRAQMLQNHLRWLERLLFVFLNNCFSYFVSQWPPQVHSFPLAFSKASLPSDIEKYIKPAAPIKSA